MTIIATSFAILFYEIRKNKKAKKPLGYKRIDKSKIRKITDRRGDIILDRYIPSKVEYKHIMNVSTLEPTYFLFVY